MREADFADEERRRLKSVVATISMESAIDYVQLVFPREAILEGSTITSATPSWNFSTGTDCFAELGGPKGPRYYGDEWIEKTRA